MVEYPQIPEPLESLQTRAIDEEWSEVENAINPDTKYAMYNNTPHSTPLQMSLTPHSGPQLRESITYLPLPSQPTFFLQL